VFLSGCQTAPVVKPTIPKPDPSIMLQCGTERVWFKGGMTEVDMANLVNDSLNLRDDCSYLNDKKKAYIESLFK
jgi:hypothetical protein